MGFSQLQWILHHNDCHYPPNGEMNINSDLWCGAPTPPSPPIIYLKLDWNQITIFLPKLCTGCFYIFRTVHFLLSCFGSGLEWNIRFRQEQELKSLPKQKTLLSPSPSIVVGLDDHNPIQIQQMPPPWFHPYNRWKTGFHPVWYDMCQKNKTVQILLFRRFNLICTLRIRPVWRKTPSCKLKSLSTS